MCRGVSPTSEIRVEIQKRGSHLLWGKNRLASELIDVQALFNDYWSSIQHEFMVPSKPPSPTRTLGLVSDHEAQRTLLSLESITSIVGL